MTPAPAGAATLCAVHPQEMAVFTCIRCGAFGCNACRAWAAPRICAACQERTDAAVGEGLSPGTLITDSFTLVGRYLVSVATLAVVSAIGTTVVGLLSSVLPQHPATAIGAGLLNLAINSVVQAAWMALIASAARKELLSTGQALSTGARFALALFAANLILGIGVGVGVMLCIVPGIILALGWSLAAPAVVVGKLGPVEGLTQSWGLTDGHRMNLFIALLVVGVLVIAVSLPVGIAETMGLAALYRVENPLTDAVKSVPMPLLHAPFAVLSSVLAAPLLAVQVVAYLRLARVREV